MSNLKIIFKFKVKLDTVLHCWRCRARIKTGEFAFVIRPEDERDTRRGFIWDKTCLDEAK